MACVRPQRHREKKNKLENVKIKFTQAMKAQRWRWMVIATPRPLYLG